MENSFFNELNQNVVDALNNDKAFFAIPGEIKMPVINNSFTGNPITGANYLNLKLSNDLNNTNHTEYVTMNEVLNSRPEWISEIPVENRPKGSLYQEENVSPDPKYSFVMPTAELNQNVIQDNLEPLNLSNNYVPFQSSNETMNNFSGLFQEQLTNAINASFTGTPFMNNLKENEVDNFKAMLMDTISKSPQFVAEIANKAYQNVLDHQYIPFAKDSFIEKARDTHSNEFNQLNSAITEHVEDMYNNKKPSFNKEFNELAEPLIENIENLHVDDMDDKSKKNVIDRETTEFVKEKIKEDKPAKVLTETFLGTFIEKAKQVAKIGKTVLAGAAFVCAFFNPEIAAGLAFVSNIIPDFSNTRKYKPDQSVLHTFINQQLENNNSEHKKIVINGNTFEGKELMKIMNFDNAPFSISGGEKPTSRDFTIAHLAEKTILGMVSKVNKDEYQKDMTNNQMDLFVAKVAKKITGISDMSNAILSNHVMKVADTIVTLQELKGDTTLRSFRENKDSRSLFAGLNQTINSNPKILDQALTQINQNTDQKTQTTTQTNQNSNQKAKVTKQPLR